MKLRKTIKNWKQIVMDKRSYLPLEPSHLQIDLQMVKRKSLARFIAYAVYRLCGLSLSRNVTVQMRNEDRGLCFFSFPYCICDTSLLTLALCLGSGYSKHTINNAYVFSIYTLEVCFRFLKWH